MFVVSKCLLGENCKYDGGNNYNQGVIDFLKDKEYIAVCPEVAGGLETPRIPCERKGTVVMNQFGENKTVEFQLGVDKCLMQINGKKIEGAILKAKSPSCGKGKIYNGSFSKTLIQGNGLFAEALIKLNIPVFTELEIEK